MRRLRVMRKADTVDDIDLQLETCNPSSPGANEVLVEVRAAGVNRSDVSAAMGRSWVTGALVCSGTETAPRCNRAMSTVV